MIWFYLLIIYKYINFHGRNKLNKPQPWIKLNIKNYAQL